jgi:hypothetical protein
VQGGYAVLGLLLVALLSQQKIYVQDEGVNKGSFGYLNFAGAGVTCAAVTPFKVMTCTVASSGPTKVQLAANVVVTSDQTASGPAFKAIPGFSWPLAASQHMRFTCHISWDADASNAAGFTATGPAGPTRVSIWAGYLSSGTAGVTSANNTNEISHHANGYSNSFQGGQDDGAAPASATTMMSGFVANGANAGTFQIGFTFTGFTLRQMTILAGSWCEYS